MAPLIPVAAALKSANLGALNNDLAVYRTHYTVGKGKKKKQIDREIHVNPVSLTVGATVAVVGVAAAVGLGAIGLYAAGMGAAVQSGVTKGRTVRQLSKGQSVQNRDGSYTEGWGRWAVCNERGVPIRYINDKPTASNVLSPSDLSRGWTVERFRDTSTGYAFDAVHSSKKTLAITTRPRGGLINIGGGSLF